MHLVSQVSHSFWDLNERKTSLSPHVSFRHHSCPFTFSSSTSPHDSSTMFGASRRSLSAYNNEWNQYYCKFSKYFTMTAAAMTTTTSTWSHQCGKVELCCVVARSELQRTSSSLVNSRDSNPGIPSIFSIPNPGIGNALIPGLQDYEKCTKCWNFTWYLPPQKYFFSQILGAIPSCKAESKQTRPQHQLRRHGGHHITGAVMLNKPFMRLRALLYSIGLDV